MDIYTIKNLKFEYPDNSDATGRKPFIPALRGVNLQIGQGDFMLVAGPSGSGKSTLLHLLKPELTPFGNVEGDILFQGKSLLEGEKNKYYEQIGFVLQDIDAQAVTDKVWHELAFGLENMGYDNDYIRRRVAEMCSYFGLEGIFHSDMASLSGGQKQLVNLASVMAMRPQVLILDEPTSQLDPIAAGDFISQLYRINQELGTTIIITEHRLEEILPYCNKMAVMDNGRIIFCDIPEKLAKSEAEGLRIYLPVAARIFMELTDCGTDAEKSEMPFTVNQGKRWLEKYAKVHPPVYALQEENHMAENADVVCSLNEVYFRYDRDGRDILEGCSIKVKRGEICVINGGNGSGKSTLLSVLAGINRPYRGKRFILKDLKISLLSQNPKDMFTGKSVRGEISEVIKRYNINDDAQMTESNLKNILKLTKLHDLLDRHPYDLSGGEQQRLALALVLLGQPDILLLDEPAKGMDAGYRRYLTEALKKLSRDGMTIILVSHDIDFCSEVADSCGLMFDGQIVSRLPVRRFYSGNSFYTTKAARIGAGIVDDAVRADDIVYAFKGEENEEKKTFDGTDGTGGTGNPKDADGICGSGGAGKPDSVENADSGAEDGSGGVGKPDSVENADSGAEDADGGSGSEKFDEVVNDILKRGNRTGVHISPFLWTTIILLLCIAAVCFYITVTQDNLNELIAGYAATGKGLRYLAVYALFIVVVSALCIILYRLLIKYDNRIILSEGQIIKRNNRKPKALSAFVIIDIFVLIPFVIWFGCEKLGDRKYYFISMVILILAMIPFFASFERRKVRTRELVTLAALCALAVTGRAAFFMLPNFNPVMAIVIISGVAYGKEAGFIVGAVSMLVSNMMFGQGPWTPWQMFAMGLMGFLAGGIFGRRSRKGIGRFGLSVFGALCAIIIYGGIMNPASVIMWQPDVNISMIITAYITGFPFDVVQGVATFAFLWLAGESMLSKIDRIRIKWGMMALRLS